MANNDSDGLIRVFRLAELYLNFAEAAYHSAGADAAVASSVAGSSAMSARDAVNAVRARSNMPAITETGDAFLLRYRNERRIEFAFEEHRYYDVRRWEILGETDNFVTGMRITKNTNDTYYYERFKLQDRPIGDDKYLLFPAKQTEVNKMLQLTGDDWQNPGW